MIAQRKFARKNNCTPLLKESFFIGASGPSFKFEMFNKYAPITIITIPESLTEVGTSPRVDAAIRVVKIGEKEAIGRRSEIGDFLSAEIERRNANKSKILAIIINAKKVRVM